MYPFYRLGTTIHIILYAVRGWYKEVCICLSAKQTLPLFVISYILKLKAQCPIYIGRWCLTVYILFLKLS